jgi:hypothetical protein
LKGKKNKDVYLIKEINITAYKDTIRNDTPGQFIEIHRKI